MNPDDFDGGREQTTTANTAAVMSTEEECASADMESPAESLSFDAVERILMHLASSTGGDPVHLCNASMIGRTWREAAKSSDVWDEMLKQRCYGDEVRESQEDERCSTQSSDAPHPLSAAYKLTRRRPPHPR